MRNAARYLVALLLSLPLLCGVSSGTGIAETTARISRALGERFPNVRIVEINPLPQLGGLYEVVTENEIAYTDANGRFLFVGRIMDTSTREDITAKRWNELRRIDFSSLPLELAIKSVRGDGSRRMAIFADPDCPFCQELEQNMQDITNVTIYTFLYPIESLHPQARAKAVAIWCANNRSAAWSEWMLKRTMPQPVNCKDEPTDRLLELGERLKINSTPALFFMNGNRNDGVLTREELERRLAAADSGK
jgi:thiol:disulfide interchange protein DsbC